MKVLSACQDEKRTKLRIKLLTKFIQAFHVSEEASEGV